MPDPQLLEASERLQSDRQPINDLLGPHEFQESEFEEGAGRCDKCGGGPLAAIHQKPIDHGEQLKRIADALEGIRQQSCSWTDSLERGANAIERTADEIEKHRINLQAGRISNSLERIADELEYKLRVGAFCRAWDWVKGFFLRVAR